jgi:hypothetical protein
MHPALPRRAAALVVCALLGLAPAAGPGRAWGADPNTKAGKTAKPNFEVRAGMTVEEVEAALGPGKPITAEQFGEPRTAVQARIRHRITAGAKALQWQDGRTWIVVVFDKDRKVAAATVRPMGD